MWLRPIALLALTWTLTLGVGCALTDGSAGAGPSDAEPVDAERPTPRPSGVGDPSSDLVFARAGKLQMDFFARCDLDGDEGPSTLQVLVHSETQVGEISRDRFVARSVIATNDEVRSLARARDPSAGRPRCREVDAPEGDVDWEISLAVSATGVQANLEEMAEVGVLRTAASQSSGQCQKSAMGEVFCCSSPYGVAVKDNLGNVRCARGQCVRTPMGQWQCARAAGGWAELDARDEPVCEQGCYAPTSTQCRRM